jgi:hypothetical protein
MEAKAESAIEEAPIPSQDTVNSPKADEGVTPGGGQDDAPDSQEQGELAEDVASPSDLEAAAALVAEELGGEEVEEIFKCDVCADQVDDKDLRDLTQIRFRKYLCREHFRDALNKAKGV